MPSLNLLASVALGSPCSVSLQVLLISLYDCSSSFFPSFNQNTSVSVIMALAVSLGKQVTEVTLERSSNRDFHHIGKKKSELLMQAIE